MINILENVVIQCGGLILSLRNLSMGTEDKIEQIGQHFSTRADRQSQELGLNILASACPNEVVIAEEQDGNKEIPLDCTVFDPLDGTTNFFNGLDEFGVTLCTFRGGKSVCSATYFPTRNMLISASRNNGCWIGGFKYGKQIKSINWHGVLDKTQIGGDIGSWTSRHETFDLVLRPISRRFNILSSMSAIESGRRVLFGNIGAYYNLGIAKIWDAAGIGLAIEEAGGIVCDPHGNPMKWNKIPCDCVMAVNLELANIVLEFTSKWSRKE